MHSGAAASAVVLFFAAAFDVRFCATQNAICIMGVSVTTKFPGEITIKRSLCTLALLAAVASSALCQTPIPSAAWHIPIGTPVANPGTQRPENNSSNIDDGPWQGAPVGGLGAGTFSRSYRGHFERWHLKAGIHKYEDVPTNQFAVFAQPEGGAPVSMALAVGKPKGGALSSWNWSYPAGDGEYAALYPKSWFAYGTKALPVKLTVEQFSPVLPNNYKETSYPVAVYRWTAENPSNKPVTVSILFSWTNMVGWFRDNLTQTFDGALNDQNFNSFVSEQSRQQGKISGIVFDRLRHGPFRTSGTVSSRLPRSPATARRSRIWPPIRPAAMDRKCGIRSRRMAACPMSAQPVASSGDPFAGAFAVRFTLGSA
jgi:non-lysosomal glucosylceramidase